MQTGLIESKTLPNDNFTGVKRMERRMEGEGDRKPKRTKAEANGGDPGCYSRQLWRTLGG